jgi:hypothetical protein
MRAISTLLKVMMSAILLVAGLYMLHETGLSKSLNEIVDMIGGAVCLSLGLLTLVSAVRSILWHRHMVRHAMPNHHRVHANRSDRNA